MKKRILFLVLTILMLISGVSGQITFQKSYNTFSNGVPSVLQTNDGGYVIAGRKLIKTDVNGDTLWTRSYNFGSSAVNSAIRTNDGGYAISGHTFSFGAGNTDCFLAKTDSLGNILWSNVYGGPRADEAYSVEQTTDNGFVISGRTRSIVDAGMDIYLIRTDLNGSLLWTKIIKVPGDGKAATVKQTNDNGFIVAGNMGQVDSTSLQSVAFITKLDNTGNVVWSKTYNGPGTEVINCIRQTTDGGYVLTGTASYFTSANIVDLFIIKTDSAGHILWSHYYDHNFSFGNSIEQTDDGGYIITGSIGVPAGNIDVCLIRTNNNGDTLWTRTFGGAGGDGGNSVKQTNDRGYVIAGTSTSFGTGFYLIKTDSMGNSGCNQSPTLFTITDTLITEQAITSTVDSGGTSASFTTLESSGTTVTPVCFSGTGINESVSARTFLLYPNPSSGTFTVTAGNTIEKGFIQVFNFYGVLVYEEAVFNSSVKEICLRSSAPGLFLVRVIDREKQYTAGKLIITSE